MLTVWRFHWQFFRKTLRNYIILIHCNCRFTVSPGIPTYCHSRSVGGLAVWSSPCACMGASILPPQSKTGMQENWELTMILCGSTVNWPRVHGVTLPLSPENSSERLHRSWMDISHSLLICFPTRQYIAEDIVSSVYSLWKGPSHSEVQTLCGSRVWPEIGLKSRPIKSPLATMNAARQCGFPIGWLCDWFPSVSKYIPLILL